MAAQKKPMIFPAPKKTLEPNREPLHVGAPAERHLAQDAEAPVTTEKAPSKKAPATAKKVPTKKESQPRKPATVPLRVDLLEEAKGFVVTTYAVPGAYKTFANFMNAALEAEVERAREKYNNGEPLPREQHNLELRTGRPMGS